MRTWCLQSINTGSDSYWIQCLLDDTYDWGAWSLAWWYGREKRFIAASIWTVARESEAWSLNLLSVYESLHLSIFIHTHVNPVIFFSRFHTFWYWMAVIFPSTTLRFDCFGWMHARHLRHTVSFNHTSTPEMHLLSSSQIYVLQIENGQRESKST